MAQLSMEEMLQSCQTASQEVYQKATERWLPPVGTYTVSIEKPRFTTFQKDGKTYGILFTSHKILDGAADVRGKSFEFGLFGNNWGHALALRELNKILFAESGPDYTADVKRYATGAIDKVVEVEVSKRHDDKSGKDYDNMTYLRQITQ